MAHTLSAKKSLRKSEKLQVANKAVKGRIGTEIKKFRRALEKGDIQAARAQSAVVTRLLHKAAANKVIHANAAARRQARMQAHLARAESGGAAAPPSAAPA